MDFTVPADYRVRLKGSKKKEKYLDLVIELKNKLWNIKVIEILIVIGALGTITKGLEDLEIKGWKETIQTIA